jgi:hypothetical protein
MSKPIFVAGPTLEKDPLCLTVLLFFFAAEDSLKIVEVKKESLGIVENR